MEEAAAVVAVAARIAIATTIKNLIKGLTNNVSPLNLSFSFPTCLQFME